MLCADLVDNCTVEHADQTAQSILNVYHLLHSELPNTHILSLAILPKGESWPNRCSDAILSVNTQLEVCPIFFHAFRSSAASLCPRPAHFSVVLLPMDKAFLYHCRNATLTNNALHTRHPRWQLECSQNAVTQPQQPLLRKVPTLICSIFKSAYFDCHTCTGLTGPQASFGGRSTDNGKHAAVQAFAELNPGFVHFADLGLAFLGDKLTAGKYDVLEALMPDSLHPSSGGRTCPHMAAPCVHDDVPKLTSPKRMLAFQHWAKGSLAGNPDSIPL